MPFPPRRSSTCADPFGADGCQLDCRSSRRTEPAYLDGLKRRARAKRACSLELSVPAKCLEDDARFAEMAALARRSGAPRVRVALLYGRATRTSRRWRGWREFADHWRRDAAAR